MRIILVVLLLVVQLASCFRRVVTNQTAKKTNNDASCLRFLLVGDFGSGDENQLKVADGMDTVAKSFEPDAILALGDNIYDRGAADADHMVSQWADIYTSKSNLKKKWYAVCGNHDWKDKTHGCGPEIAYTKDSKNPSKLWQLPHFWHNKSFRAGGLTVDAFFIDTEIWRGNNATDKREEQRSELISKLSSSNADWKIMVGHVSMYSVGTKGSNSGMRKTLDPIMRNYKANIYISGHDHNQQHIQYQKMNYITAGAGSKTRKGKKKNLPSGRQLQYFDDELGFSTLEICDSSKATLKMYRASGSEQYTATLMNEQPPGGDDGTPFTPDSRRRSGSGGSDRRRRRRSSRRSKRTRSDVTDEEDESMYVDQAVCGGVDLHVDLRCSDHKEDGCTVVPAPDVPCTDFCEAHGLTCIGAWSNFEGGCRKVAAEECSSYLSSEASQICQCAPA